MVIGHPHYTPDLTPADFCQFRKVKPPQHLKTLQHRGHQVEQSAKLNIILLDTFCALCIFQKDEESVLHSGETTLKAHTSV